MTQITLPNGTIQIDTEGQNISIINSHAGDAVGSISVLAGDEGSYPQFSASVDRSFIMGSVETSCLESNGTKGGLSLRTLDNGFKTMIVTEPNTKAADQELIAPSETGRLITSNVKQSDSDPTTSDIADGTFAVWYNTTTGYAKFWMNIGGDLASLTFNFPSTATTEVVGGRPRHLS